MLSEVVSPDHVPLLRSTSGHSHSAHRFAEGNVTVVGLANPSAVSATTMVAFGRWCRLRNCFFRSLGPLPALLDAFLHAAVVEGDQLGRR